MELISARLTGPNRSGDLAVIVVVVVAYLVTFTTASAAFSQLESALLILAGVVFTLLGLSGAAVCERVGSLTAAATYLAVQIALGTAILYLSRGQAWLILLPLVGQGVVLLPRWGVVVVSGLVLVALLTPLSIHGDWGDVVPTALRFLAAIVFVAVVTQIAVSEQKARAEVERLAAELAAANQKLRDYAVQAKELATIKERNRLAREIHDSLGHYLTVVNVQIAAARAVMERDQPRALETLEKAQMLTQEALGEVRRSVTALRAPPSTDRPLPEAIAALVDASRAAGIDTELFVAGAPRPLAPAVELAVYRAAQEALTNVRKHAQASRADLTLDYRNDGWVQLTVRDNGLGATHPGDGFGLLGLSERVQLLGGRVATQTAAGQGFTLEVEVPG